MPRLNMVFITVRHNSVLYWKYNQLGYKFRPCGGHHQASTMYWSCQYINDILPNGIPCGLHMHNDIRLSNSFNQTLAVEVDIGVAVYDFQLQICVLVDGVSLTRGKFETYIFNRSWFDTRWQQYITHLHTDSTHNTEKGKLGCSGRAPSLRIIPWHLPYNWGKSTEKSQG
jgi:hypothetical protein